MPYGKGTYGSKVGRPKKRKTKAKSAKRKIGGAKKTASRARKSRVAASAKRAIRGSRKVTKKNVTGRSPSGGRPISGGGGKKKP
tara:strand:- start:485 stop:736 length:252 start_codon:yes stop_codon:yes gene_type:complete